MSQNIRADGASSMPHGSSSKLLGSGSASTSLSCTRLNPSMAEPSNCMPSAKAALELGRGGLDRLQLAEHIGEPQPDVADPALLDRAQHVVLLAFHHPNMLTWWAGATHRRFFPFHTPFTYGQQRGNAPLSSSLPNPDLDQGTNDLQGRIHLDRRHRADGQAAVQDEDHRRGRRRSQSSADLGLRRLQHEPGPGRATRTACCSRSSPARTRSAAATTSSCCARCCSPT